MTITKISGYIAFVTLFVGFASLFVPTHTVSAYTYSAPTCTFNSIVQPTNNGGTTLSWKAVNAHTVSISGIGTVSDADARVVYPNAETTYTLTAVGYGGTTTCTTTAHPVSAYSFGTQNTWNVYNQGQTCSLWVNPDLVVAGGTGILSWDAGNAQWVSIDHGVGTVGTTGSRTVANIGLPQVFTMTAKWGNGVVKNCSATVTPVGFATTKNGIAVPTYNGVGTPHVTATYVALNQVPYTGTSDVAYVFTLLAVALGALGFAYTKRDVLANAVRK